MVDFEFDVFKSPFSLEEEKLKSHDITSLTQIFEKAWPADILRNVSNDVHKIKAINEHVLNPFLISLEHNANFEKLRKKHIIDLQHVVITLDALHCQKKPSTPSSTAAMTT